MDQSQYHIYRRKRLILDWNDTTLQFYGLTRITHFSRAALGYVCIMQNRKEARNEEKITMQIPNDMQIIKT
jgi:hypothetical protein